MKSYSDISIDELDEAYKKFPPNIITILVFRYFSKSTEKEDLKIKDTLSYIFIISFAVGFIGTILNLPDSIIATATWIYAVLNISIVIFMLMGVWSNNKRIKKVVKHLDIDLTEYNKLLFYYNLKKII